MAAGNAVLAEVLGPAGFSVGPTKSGKGSGGNFAVARWTRREQSLELHTRFALGIVLYGWGTRCSIIVTSSARSASRLRTPATATIRSTDSVTSLTICTVHSHAFSGQTIRNYSSQRVDGNRRPACFRRAITGDLLGAPGARSGILSACQTEWSFRSPTSTRLIGKGESSSCRSVTRASWTSLPRSTESTGKPSSRSSLALTDRRGPTRSKTLSPRSTPRRRHSTARHLHSTRRHNCRSARRARREIGHYACVATQVAVEAKSPRSVSRGWVIAAIVVGVIFLELALSTAWPRVVPRLAFLPRPPDRTWTTDCSPHHLFYTRNGLFWGSNDTSLPIACAHG